MELPADKLRGQHPDTLRVLRYAERWGVRVVPAGGELRATDVAPLNFFGGIHWPKRTIVFDFDTAADEGALSACLLAHELSHVLCGKDPCCVDEVGSSMLALDYYAARRLRLLDWSAWMYDYSTGDGLWRGCTTRQRGQLIAQSLAEAVRSGLLDQRGRPTFNRSAWAPPRGAGRGGRRAQ